MKKASEKADVFQIRLKRKELKVNECSELHQAGWKEERKERTENG